MEVIENVKHELGELIKKKFEGETQVANVIEYLFATRIINQNMALRYLIQSEYYEGIKDQTRGCVDLKHDLAEKYDVEYDFVKNAIYKYKFLPM